MSLQQSEAHQDRMRDITPDEAPPPSLRAIRRATANNAAHRRRTQTEVRRREEIAEAAALGVTIIPKTTIDNSWTEDEDNAIRSLYPHHAKISEKLPHRTYYAIKRRIAVLDIKSSRNFWTPKEENTLRSLWLKATKAELVAALPRWAVSKIDDKARHLGLPPRGKPPLAPTGNALCDEIRDRCRVLGYTMNYLDRIACTSTYFQSSLWKGRSGHLNAPMIRAVNALGGELRVEWPD